MKSINQNQEGENNELAGRDINKINTFLHIHVHSGEKPELLGILINRKQKQVEKRFFKSISKKLKKNIVMYFIIISFSAIVTTVFKDSIINLFYIKSDIDSIELEPTTEEISDLISENDYLAFTLTPEEILTVDEFKRATEIIESRLSTLSSDFTSEVNLGSIDVTIPRTSLADKDSDEYSLLKPLDILCGVYQEHILFYSPDKVFELFKYAIHNYNINHELMDESVLILNLSDRSYKAIKSMVDNEKIVMNFPYAGSGYIYDFDDEENAIFIKNKLLTYGNVCELFFYSLLYKQLPCSFNYVLDFENIVSWDKPEDYGENQVSNVDGVTVDLFFNAHTYHQETDEMWKLAKDTMKKRIESLGINYQYGYKNLGDKVVVVRLPIKYVGECVIDLLKYNNEKFIVNLMILVIK